MNIPHCTGCGEYPGEYVADEIETLRKRVAELDIDVAAWTNTAHILDSRAEKAKARIAELEKKLEGMADLAQGEFSRAEKAEAHIVELDRELINIRRSRRKAEAALTEARDRLDQAERDADIREDFAHDYGHDEGFRAGIEAASCAVMRMVGIDTETQENICNTIEALSPSDNK